jgi:hypothetical protein
LRTLTHREGGGNGNGVGSGLGLGVVIGNGLAVGDGAAAGGRVAGFACSEEEPLQACAVNADVTSKRKMATRVRRAIARDPGIELFRDLSLCAKHEIGVLGCAPSAL